MTFISGAKTLLKRFTSVFNPPVSRSHPVITAEALTTLLNYQVVVIAPQVTTLKLPNPLLDITIDLKQSLIVEPHLFPFVVGNNGQLLSPDVGRKVTFTDIQRSSLYLEYPLDQNDNTRVILRIIGNDPQTIRVVLDQRTAQETPIILFLWKSRQL